MPTLLLKFNAPLQSWGTSLKLNDHETDMYPSKSGVIGMIASALGRRRDADISDLARLRFGVRIDNPGTLIDDFQVSKIPMKKGKIGHRKYLSDACFICGIEAESSELEMIREALCHPANALFLGRRGCPVTADLVIKIVDDSLGETLENYDKANGFKQIIMDTDNTFGEAVRDVPVSFSPFNRQYQYRFIKCR